MLAPTERNPPTPALFSGFRLVSPSAIRIDGMVRGQYLAVSDLENLIRNADHGRPVRHCDDRDARREILQVLRDNHTSDASRRMTEEMVLAGIKPTPHGIWSYLDSRGRNSSIGMPFDEAVRTFLTQHPVTIQKDAVYFYGRKYRSQALINTGVFDRVARNGVIQASAFSLVMCVRHIWVEVEGLLYKLDFVRTASMSESNIDISLRDLKEIDEMRRAGAADLRYERPAIQQDFMDRFKKDTGEEWDGGQRKLGRPAKGGAALRDTADFNRFRGKAK
ncbi:hypothetical protein D9M71_227480 [compost metagenome]